MPWFVYAILAAFCDAGKHLYGKKLTGKFDEYLLSFSSSVLVVCCLLPVLGFVGIPAIGVSFALSLVITGTINAITLVLILKALRLTDISLVAPLFALSPALLLFTSPVMLGEFPSLLGLVGVVCILWGTYILNFQKKLSWDPILTIFQNQGQRLILVVTVLWAISSNFYKIGMANSSPVFFIFSLNVVISLLLFPFMLRAGRINIVRHHWKQIMPLGLLSAATSLFQWMTVSMTLVVYALSLKRLSILLSVMGGIFFFQEKNSIQKIMATGLILLGVAVVALS